MGGLDKQKPTAVTELTGIVPLVSGRISLGVGHWQYHTGWVRILHTILRTLRERRVVVGTTYESLV